METPLFSNLFFTTLREASASPHRIWLNHMDYLVQMEMDAFPVYIIVLLHKGEWIKVWQKKWIFYCHSRPIQKSSHEANSLLYSCYLNLTNILEPTLLRWNKWERELLDYICTSCEEDLTKSGRCKTEKTAGPADGSVGCIFCRSKQMGLWK